MDNLKTNRIYRAAIYVRLSKEDGDKEVSDSIINQKDLIRAFLADKPDIEICEECADDADIIGLNQKATQNNFTREKRTFQALCAGNTFPKRG